MDSQVGHRYITYELACPTCLFCFFSRDLTETEGVTKGLLVQHLPELTCKVIDPTSGTTGFTKGLLFCQTKIAIVRLQAASSALAVTLQVTEVM